MYQLSGEYACKMDAKGRLKLPSALLRQLGAEIPAFVLNRGFEKCLTMYPKNVWDQKTNELGKLNTFKSKHRNFIRVFVRGATQVQPDTSDRILIPQSLRMHADISKHVMLIGLLDHVEIWPRDAYLEFMDIGSDEMAKMSDEVFDEKSENADE